MTSIGRVFVDVAPDTSGFAEKMRGELSRVMQNLKVQVTPDTTGFKAKLQAELASARGADIKVKVQPDLTGFRAKLQQEARAYANGVDAKVKIQPDLTGFRSKLQQEARAYAGGVDAKVKVAPDLTGFRTKLRAELNSLQGQDLKVRLQPDATGFRATLRALLATIDQTIKVRVVPDMTGFRALLRAQLAAVSAQSVRVRVDVDSNHLRTQVRAAIAAASAGQHINIPVNITGSLFGRRLAGGGGGGGGLPDIGGGSAGAELFKLFGFRLGLAALIPEVTGFAAAVSGALTPLVALMGSAIPSAAVGMGAAFAAAFAAASGPLNALKALSAARKTETSDAMTAANQQRTSQVAIRNATQQVANAQDSLRQAYADAGRAGQDSARAVTKAQQDLARTQERAAEANAQASQQVQDAERGVTDAERDAVQAQRDLNEAREQAVEDLDNMRRALRQTGLDERSATLDVQEAQQRINELRMDPKATNLERARAQLAYDEAVAHLDDTKDRLKDQQKEYANASKAGVEGSKAVQDAQRNAWDTAVKVGSAWRDLGRAQHDQTQTAKDGAQAVADAQQGVTDAIQNQQRTAEDSARSIRQAQQGVADAQQAVADAMEAASQKSVGSANKIADAMKDLSPAARRFVDTLWGLRPAWVALQQATQEALFPGVTDMVNSIASTLPNLTPILATTAGVMGNLARDFGTMFASPAWQKDIREVGMQNATALDQFGHAGLGVLDIFRNLSAVAAPFVTEFASAVRRTVEGWQQQIEVARQTGKLTELFEKAKEVGKELTHILSEGWKGLWNILKDGYPFGKQILDLIQGWAESFHRWTEDVKSQQGIHDFFHGMVVVFEGLAGVIGIAAATVGIFIADIGKIADWDKEHGGPLQQFWKDLGVAILGTVKIISGFLVVAMEKFGLWYQQNRTAIIGFFKELGQWAGAVGNLVGAIVNLFSQLPFGAMTAFIRGMAGLTNIAAALASMAASVPGIAPLVGILLGVYGAIRLIARIGNLSTLLGIGVGTTGSLTAAGAAGAVGFGTAFLRSLAGLRSQIISSFTLAASAARAGVISVGRGIVQAFGGAMSATLMSGGFWALIAIAGAVGLGFLFQNWQESAKRKAAALKEAVAKSLQGVADELARIQTIQDPRQEVVALAGYKARITNAVSDMAAGVSDAWRGARDIMASQQDLHVPREVYERGAQSVRDGWALIEQSYRDLPAKLQGDLANLHDRMQRNVNTILTSPDSSAVQGAIIDLDNAQKEYTGKLNELGKSAGAAIDEARRNAKTAWDSFKTDVAAAGIEATSVIFQKPEQLAASGNYQAALDLAKPAIDRIMAARDAVQNAIKTGPSVLADWLTGEKGQKASIADIQTFLDTTISNTKGFLDDYREALKNGFDPAFVASLFAKGPEAASGAMDTLAKTTNKNIVGQVNDSIQELTRLSNEAVRQAAIIQTAFEHPQSTLPRTEPRFAGKSELDISQQINAIITANPKASAEEVARQVNKALKTEITPGDVNEIWGRFGFKPLITQVQQLAGEIGKAVGQTVNLGAAIGKASSSGTTAASRLGKSFGEIGSQSAGMAPKVGSALGAAASSVNRIGDAAESAARRAATAMGGIVGSAARMAGGVGSAVGRAAASYAQQSRGETNLAVGSAIRMGQIVGAHNGMANGVGGAVGRASGSYVQQSRNQTQLAVGSAIRMGQIVGAHNGMANGVGGAVGRAVGAYERQARNQTNLAMNSALRMGQIVGNSARMAGGVEAGVGRSIGAYARMQGSVDRLHGKKFDVKSSASVMYPPDAQLAGALKHAADIIRAATNLGAAVAPHAEGGIDRIPSQATISGAQGRGFVQWAEAETGGEAYIPLAPSKRDRSMSIWRETGRLLGAYFDGGMVNIDTGVNLGTFQADTARHQTIADFGAEAMGRTAAEVLGRVAGVILGQEIANFVTSIAVPHGPGASVTGNWAAGIRPWVEYIARTLNISANTYSGHHPAESHAVDLAISQAGMVNTAPATGPSGSDLYSNVARWIDKEILAKATPGWYVGTHAAIHTRGGSWHPAMSQVGRRGQTYSHDDHVHLSFDPRYGGPIFGVPGNYSVPGFDWDHGGAAPNLGLGAALGGAAGGNLPLGSLLGAAAGGRGWSQGQMETAAARYINARAAHILSAIAMAETGGYQFPTTIAPWGDFHGPWAFMRASNPWADPHRLDTDLDYAAWAAVRLWNSPPVGPTTGKWQVWPGMAARYMAEGGILGPNGPGLVRYAEQSTGGESYIPLSADVAQRGRSIEIWRETGRLLGQFATGGIRRLVYGDEDWGRSEPRDSVVAKLVQPVVETIRRTVQAPATTPTLPGITPQPPPPGKPPTPPAPPTLGQPPAPPAPPTPPQPPPPAAVWPHGPGPSFVGTWAPGVLRYAQSIANHFGVMASTYPGHHPDPGHAIDVAVGQFGMNGSIPAGSIERATDPLSAIARWIEHNIVDPGPGWYVGTHASIHSHWQDAPGGWRIIGSQVGRRWQTYAHDDHIHLSFPPWWGNAGNSLHSAFPPAYNYSSPPLINSWVGRFDEGGLLMPGITFAQNTTGRPERVVAPSTDDKTVALLIQLVGLIGEQNALLRRLPVASADALNSVAYRAVR